MQEFLSSARRWWSGARSYELRKAEERAHILEGYRIALDNIDEIVELIKTSESPDAARSGLMERFGLSEMQAQAILDMRLARLTGLERQKIEDEYRELIEKHRRTEGHPRQPRPGAADHPRGDRARSATPTPTSAAPTSSRTRARSTSRT